MASANKGVWIGNLTKKPDLKETKNGSAYTRFSIAVNRRYKSSNGEWVEEVDFLPIIAWGPRGEACANNLDKGRSVAVFGRIRTYQTEDTESGKKYTQFEIVADDVQFLGAKPSTRSDAAEPESVDQPAEEKPHSEEMCPF